MIPDAVNSHAPEAPAEGIMVRITVHNVASGLKRRLRTRVAGRNRSMEENADYCTASVPNVASRHGAFLERFGKNLYASKGRRIK